MPLSEIGWKSLPNVSATMPERRESARCHGGQRTEEIRLQFGLYEFFDDSQEKLIGMDIAFHRTYCAY
jgi:hypothetical protein